MADEYNFIGATFQNHKVVEASCGTLPQVRVMKCIQAWFQTNKYFMCYMKANVLDFRNALSKIIYENRFHPFKIFLRNLRHKPLSHFIVVVFKQLSTIFAVFLFIL